MRAGMRAHLSCWHLCRRCRHCRRCRRCRHCRRCRAASAGAAAAATAADDTQPAGDPLVRHQTSDLQILVLHQLFLYHWTETSSSPPKIFILIILIICETQIGSTPALVQTRAIYTARWRHTQLGQEEIEVTRARQEDPRGQVWKKAQRRQCRRQEKRRQFQRQGQSRCCWTTPDAQTHKMHQEDNA